MRVIAGSRRSIPLETPAGMDVRPTTDRIKETLFNIISDRVWGKRFLDLFAGSGQIGIEALSRGASCCVFVEKDQRAIAAIKENISKTRFEEQSGIIRGDIRALTVSKRIQDSYDIIFMDPPYAYKYQEELISDIIGSGLLNDDGLLILEADIHTKIPEEPGVYKLVREKRYKTNKHLFFEKA